MDPNRFDEMTRALGAGMSRRMALKSIAGALAGGWLAARSREVGAQEYEPVRPTRRPLFCIEGKHCGDVCCAATETCVGLNQPVDLGGGSGEPGVSQLPETGQLQCICQHDYVRDRTGTCVCPADKTCGASCCGDGQTCCDGECVDTDHSQTNCGACGLSCKGAHVCQAGQCACPPETMDCGGTCVPLVNPNGQPGCCSDLDCAEHSFCCTAGLGAKNPCGGYGCGEHPNFCTACL